MGNLLYTIALVLFILWIIGYVGFNIGGIIHVLVVAAIIMVLIRIIQGKNPIQ